MAGVIATGYIGTEEPLSDERKIDMDEVIRRAKTDDAQFKTMSERTSSKTAVREKVNWLEEEDFPRLVTSSAALVGDTTINLTAGQGKIVHPNDSVRDTRSGERWRTTVGATDALTVARGIGTSPAAAVNASDAWLVVADTQPQGSDFPTARYLQRVLGYNFTQITRTVWTFTNTTTA